MTTKVTTPAPLVDIETVPEQTQNLILVEQLQQTLSLLLGWDGQGRRMLRCSNDGILYRAPWYARYPGVFTRYHLYTSDIEAWETVVGVTPFKGLFAMAYDMSFQLRVKTGAAGDYKTIYGIAGVMLEFPVAGDVIEVRNFPSTDTTDNHFGFTLFS